MMLLEVVICDCETVRPWEQNLTGVNTYCKRRLEKCWMLLQSEESENLFAFGVFRSSFRVENEYYRF
jgi:hypothetical protein